jgi:WD40 repeat protein
VRLWDVSPAPIPSGEEGIANRRRCLATFDLHGGDVYAVQFIPVPGGKDLLAAGYIDGTVRVWDLAAFDSCLAGHLAFQTQRHNELMRGTMQ